MPPCNDNFPGLAVRAYREMTDQLRLRGETSACAIFEATRVALDMPEEVCGGEIYDGIFLAIRQGLIGCNTHDAAEDVTTIGRATVLWPIATTMQ